MICDIYNIIEKHVKVTIFDTHPCYRTEISLTTFISQIIVGLFFILLVSWWMFPIRRIFKWTDGITFKCNKNKGD